MNDEDADGQPLQVEHSGIVFAPPTGLTLARLLDFATAAVTAAGAQAAGRTLQVEQVPGTALLRVSVDEPVPLLGQARTLSAETPGPVLAWEADEHVRQTVALYRGNTPELEHTVDESAGGTTEAQDAALRSLLEDLAGRGPGALAAGATPAAPIRVALDAPADVVTAREAELKKLLAGLPASRATDEGRLVERVKRFQVEAATAAPTGETGERKPTSDPEAVRAADRTIKTFLIVSVLILAAMGALFAFLAARRAG